MLRRGEETIQERKNGPLSQKLTYDQIPIEKILRKKKPQELRKTQNPIGTEQIPEMYYSQDMQKHWESYKTRSFDFSNARVRLYKL